MSPRSSPSFRGGKKSGLERAAEIEPIYFIYRRLSRVREGAPVQDRMTCGVVGGVGQTEEKPFRAVCHLFRVHNVICPIDE